MAKYKNIRVKKPKGGYRTQRVQVLKSGKYKFVKNKPARKIGKRAMVSRRPSRKYRAAPKRRRTSMARRRYKKKRGGSKKRYFPLGALPLIFGVGGMLWEVWNAVKERNWGAAMTRSIKYSVGYDMTNKSFDFGNAYVLLGGIGMWVIHKGIGGYLGVNRMLGQAKVPFVRL